MMKAVMRDEREMKDSGIEWIGKIPRNWDVFKLKNIVKITSGNYLNKDDFNPNGDYAVIGSNGEIGRYDNVNVSGTVLITGRVGTVGTTKLIESAWVTDNALILDSENTNCLRFLYYLLPCLDYRLLLAGTAQPLITATKLKNQYIPNVGVEIQQAIASYLDDRCSKIDAIIAEAKASIEEYKELKQAVIYEAVTKGLDSDTKMKESGVEWVGKIPNHWEYKKLRYSINDIGDIDHYMPESIPKGIPYIMTGDLKNRVSEIDFDTCKQVSRRDYEKLSTKIKAEKGDIIFARYATIGALCYVDIDADFLVSYSCVIIKPDTESIDSHFLEFYLQSNAFLEEAKRYANSNVQANIGKESMFQAKIALPPLDEQKSIVKFLDLKVACLNDLINEKLSLIEDLEAYKKSLIYEVVTGKRKVVA